MRLEPARLWYYTSRIRLRRHGPHENIGGNFAPGVIQVDQAILVLQRIAAGTGPP